MRNAAESNFCATSVTSIVAGGLRQLSQLPQVAAGSSPKWRSRIARRQVAASTKPASAFKPLAFARAAVGLDLGLDPAPRAREIVGAPEQPRLGRVAVAPGAAGFLVIGLDRLGRAGVGDEAHVGLVDPHPEGDRRGDDHVFGRDEGRLVALAHRAVEPGVIGARRAPGAAELLGDLLGRDAAGGVDDARARCDRRAGS